MTKVIPVTAGTFECPHCFALWVGSWRGDPSLMTCPKCEKPLHGGFNSRV